MICRKKRTLNILLLFLLFSSRLTNITDIDGTGLRLRFPEFQLDPNKFVPKPPLIVYCRPGYHLIDDIICLPCHPGHYSAPFESDSEIEADRKHCIPCELNHYTPEFGSVACLECPKNGTTKEVGRTKESDCDIPSFFDTVPKVYLYTAAFVVACFAVFLIVCLYKDRKRIPVWYNRCCGNRLDAVNINALKYSNERKMHLKSLAAAVKLKSGTTVSRFGHKKNRPKYQKVGKPEKTQAASSTQAESVVKSI